MTRIMITNNTDGNHTVADWALTSAETLCDITGLDGSRRLAGHKLQIRFADVLADLHRMVQETERERLSADPAYLAVNRSDELESVCRETIAKLVSLTSDTEWAQHFARPDVQETMHAELLRHLATSVHVERLYHTDRHPEDKYAQEYKLYHGAISAAA